MCELHVLSSFSGYKRARQLCGPRGPVLLGEAGQMCPSFSLLHTLKIMNLSAAKIQKNEDFLV